MRFFLKLSKLCKSTSDEFLNILRASNNLDDNSQARIVVWNKWPKSENNRNVWLVFTLSWDSVRTLEWEGANKLICDSRARTWDTCFIVFNSWAFASKSFTANKRPRTIAQRFVLSIAISRIIPRLNIFNRKLAMFVRTLDHFRTNL